MIYTIDNQSYKFITIEEDSSKATLFRHFKGKMYKIYTIAKDSETLEDIVVYQQQYDSFKYFVRPCKMFFSNVDHTKYPEVKQQKRFMIVD